MKPSGKIEIQFESLTDQNFLDNVLNIFKICVIWDKFSYSSFISQTEKLGWLFLTSGSEKEVLKKDNLVLKYPIPQWGDQSEILREFAQYEQASKAFKEYLPTTYLLYNHTLLFQQYIKGSKKAAPKQQINILAQKLKLDPIELGCNVIVDIDGNLKIIDWVPKCREQ